MQTGVTYRFNIVNLMKGESNYNQGMKPLLYSMHRAENEMIGWHRAGENIAYYSSQRKRRGREDEPPPFHALSFEIKFEYTNDRVYIAHCYPYTYTDLRNFIRSTVTMDVKDRIRKTILCQSNAGNDVDVLIVTNFSSTPMELSVRKAVILTARVHPGETQASWMLQGVIDFLVSDDETAVYLRDQYVFKIVPM